MAIAKIPGLLFGAVLAHVLAPGCNREPEGRFAQAGSEEPAPPSGPLRYGSTILAASRPGETATALVEVASPAAGRMRAIVAVIRPGNALAVEIWTFDQRKAGVLELAGEPTPALRLHGSDRSAPALADLRRELSVPAAEVHRLLGLAAADPAAAIAAMEVAAKAMRAPEQGADARLEALVTVVRGLDDGPLLEQDGLGRALDELVAGAWAPTETRTLSDRRAEITTRSGTVLELHRLADGWAIAAIR